MVVEFLGGVSQNPAAVSAFAALLVVAAVTLSKSKQSRAPPIVSYWVPWIGSAVTLGKDPDGFFKRASEKLGPVFRVLAAGKNMTYVTSPELINAIYRDAKTFDFVPIRWEISENVFQIPMSIVMSPNITSQYYPDHHRLLAPKNIGPILDLYSRYAFEDLSSRIQSLNGSSTPLFQLLIPPAYSAASAAFFGREFPAGDAYEDFATFNDAFHLIGAGVPRWMLPTPYKAWDRVISRFEAYLGTLKDKNPEDLPELVRLTMETSARGEYSDRVTAAMLGGDFWAMQANAIWAAYWFVVDILQRPDAFKAVIQELDTVRNDWMASNPSTPLTATTFALFMRESGDKLSLMSSGLLETLRLRTSTFSIRRVAVPTEFAGFQFNVGDQLICATRSVHLDEEIHDDPASFKLERYVDGPSKKISKNGKTVPNHSMPFGGGVSMCEGRHFAQSEIRILVALLLTYCTLEPAPGTSWPEMRMDRLGVGIISPKGDVNVLVKQKQPTV